MQDKIAIPPISEVKNQGLKLLKSKHFRKYLAAGFTAFFVDFMVFRTMYIVLDLDLKLSTFCGIVAGFITSFLLQKFWSFKGSQAKKAHHQVFIYLALTIVNTLFTELVIKEAETLGLKHGAELGKVIATGFIVIWNFIIFKLVVFRKSEDKD
jgi:putative flippase GtrA